MPLQMGRHCLCSSYRLEFWHATPVFCTIKLGCFLLHSELNAGVGCPFLILAHFPGKMTKKDTVPRIGALIKSLDVVTLESYFSITCTSIWGVRTQQDHAPARFGWKEFQLQQIMNETLQAAAILSVRQGSVPSQAPDSSVPGADHIFDPIASQILIVGNIKRG